MPEMLVATHKIPSEREGKCKLKYKVEESIAQTSKTSPWPVTKVACAMNSRMDPAIVRRKDLNTAKAFSYQEKKEKAKLNKFEALFMLSTRNAGDSNSKS
eukprot:628514-Ditylum_brightwellii.AAC.1